jgi:hypothetical protein
MPKHTLLPALEYLHETNPSGYKQVIRQYPWITQLL